MASRALAVSRSVEDRSNKGEPMLSTRPDRRRPLNTAIFIAIASFVVGGGLAIANNPGTDSFDYSTGNAGAYALGLALASLGPLALVIGAILEVPERMADLLRLGTGEGTVRPSTALSSDISEPQISIPTSLRVELLRQYSDSIVSKAAVAASGPEPSDLAAAMKAACADIYAGIDPAEAWRRATS